MHPYTSEEFLEGEKTKTSKSGILGEKARGIGKLGDAKKKERHKARWSILIVWLSLCEFVYVYKFETHQGNKRSLYTHQ